MARYWKNYVSDFRRNLENRLLSVFQFEERLELSRSVYIYDESSCSLQRALKQRRIPENRTTFYFHFVKSMVLK